MQNKILDFLEQNNIAFVLYEHPQFFTVEEGKEFEGSIVGANSKNLFLKDKKKNFFLISILSHKRVDLKTLSKTYGRGGLSFANEDELKTCLNLLPGSVTPYGLIHDTDCKVTFLLDSEFIEHEFVNFHPLRNDMTISVKTDDFIKVCSLINHIPSMIEIG